MRCHVFVLFRRRKGNILKIKVFKLEVSDMATRCPPRWLRDGSSDDDIVAKGKECPARSVCDSSTDEEPANDGAFPNCHSFALLLTIVVRTRSVTESAGGDISYTFALQPTNSHFNTFHCF